MNQKLNRIKHQRLTFGSKQQQKQFGAKSRPKIEMYKESNKSKRQIMGENDFDHMNGNQKKN